MKKLFLFICLTALAVSAFSQGGENFEVEIIDGSISITGYTGFEESIRIPEKIYNKAVTSIGDFAFSGKQITSVNIPHSVAIIGDGAFYDNRIINLVIPRGVTHIGIAAFANNEISTVTIPNSIRHIGISAFSNNRIRNIIIPRGLSSIEPSAFSDNRITSVIIPYGVTTIGDYAFYNNQITNINLSDTVTAIGDYAFSKNSIRTVRIPKSVTEIGRYAFFMNKITSLNLFAEDSKDANEIQRNTIEQYDTKFSIGINAKFNFLNYGNTDLIISSNAPVFMGFSFAYKDYGAFFSFSFPYTYTKTQGKNTPFDAGLSFYQENWSEELTVKSYDDWYFEEKPFGMQFITANLQGTYIFNEDNFSLRAVYPMNRIQRVSSGSLIAGGNIRFTTVKSNNISVYNERWWGVAPGPSIGYSYTFVTKNFFFVNFNILTGVGLGIDLSNPSVFFSPYLMPKIAIGKHNKTWSFNFVLEFDYISFMGAKTPHDFFLFNSASPNFVKRF